MSLFLICFQIKHFRFLVTESMFSHLASEENIKVFKHHNLNIRTLELKEVCSYPVHVQWLSYVWDSMDCSPLDYSVPGIFQARILKWWTSIPGIKPLSLAYSASAGGFLTTEPPGKPQATEPLQITLPSFNLRISTGRFANMSRVVPIL